MMKQLNKITISNIRRFSQKVEIEVGKGATIILAPNGTGKTAIFEAIELALTGTVKRLDNPPDPLIRDNQTESLIRLDFDSGKYCQATFQKGQVPVISGNHDELFGYKERPDTPFLLRLTHILNQRANDWFVQSNGIDAGGQLDHLSIGRDAVHVKSLMQSAKRAATGMGETAKRELEEAEGRMKAWMEILEKRNSVNVGLISSLVSRGDLVKRINTVSENIEVFQTATSEDLSFIKSQLNAVSSAAERALVASRSTAVSLETTDQVVKEFLQGIEALLKSADHLASTKNAKKRIEDEITGLHNEMNTLDVKLSGNESSLKTYQELKRKIDLLSKNVEDTLIISTNLENLREKLVTVNQLVQTSKTNFEQAQKILEIHRGLQIRSQALSMRHIELLALEKAYLRWVELGEKLDDIERNVLPDLKIRESGAKQRLTAVHTEQELNQVKLGEAQRSFDTLNATSDAIREAVGIIVTQFPQDKGDCPVCLAQYAPEKLRTKMTQALNAMDPELEPAAKRLDSAKGRVNEGNAAIVIAENENKETEMRLNKVNEEITSLKEELNTIMSNFPGSSNAVEAEKYLKGLFSVYEVDKGRLDLEKLEATAEPSKEQMALFQDEESKQHAEFLSLTEQIRVAGSMMKDLEDLKVSLEKSLGESEDILNLNEKIVAQETVIAISRAEIETFRTTLNQKQLSLNETSDILRHEEKEHSDLNTRIIEYRARWSELKLEGEPSIHILENAKTEISGKIQTLENKRKELDIVYTELARWEAADDYFKAEEDIKKISAELSETDYTNRLKNDIELFTKRAETTSLKANTLNIFSRQLDSELDTVHERIRSINPLWNKLLKRIVVDPRFAETSLNSYSYYNKQHADVNVQLHGKGTLVSQVASEAQITDLQLTFLLAMAQKYQWSPWRILLLDDPTQHHDLVHAAAVFDLLRDYIVEYDFQIVLATHDSVQAKYFMRKLENDGIPSRLWTLNAAEGGVTAVLN